MGSPFTPHPAREPGAETPERHLGRSPRLSSARESLTNGWEEVLAASNRYLHLVQDTLLVAVAAVMLLLGVYVLITAVGDLISDIWLRVQASEAIAPHGDDGPSVVAVGENALLALILGELVGTLLLSTRGRPLTIEPFLIIAVVAIVRHLLFLTVRTDDDPVLHTIEILGTGGLVLLLVGALALIHRTRARNAPARRSELET